MTQNEIDTAVAQAKEANFVLNNYTAWSNREKLAKRPHDGNAWAAACEAIRHGQYNDNLDARNNRLAKIEEEQKAKQAEADAKTDVRLEPRKQQLKRDWLANNPSFSEKDFETKAWPHLKHNLLENDKQTALQAELASGAQSGRYSL